MATLNKYQCIGHLGKDPVRKETNEGTPYTRFSVAVDQGKDKEPIWWNVVCWRDLAERMERLLSKGAQVYIEGKLVPRKYTDEKGIEHQTFDLAASDVQLLDKRQGNTSVDLNEPLS